MIFVAVVLIFTNLGVTCFLDQPVSVFILLCISFWPAFIKYFPFDFGVHVDDI